jgi:hypothetical protein
MAYTPDPILGSRMIRVQRIAGGLILTYPHVPAVNREVRRLGGRWDRRWPGYFLPRHAEPEAAERVQRWDHLIWRQTIRAAMGTLA